MRKEGAYDSCIIFYLSRDLVFRIGLTCTTYIPQYICCWCSIFYTVCVYVDKLSCYAGKKDEAESHGVNKG